MRTSHMLRCVAIACLCVMLASISPLILFVPPTAFAATFGVVPLVTSSRTVEPAAVIPAFKITFGTTEAGQTLSAVGLTFQDANTSGATWTQSSGTSSTLADLTSDATSGITLYRDSGMLGSFDAQSDTLVPLTTSVYGSVGSVMLTPASPPSINDGDTYFVVFNIKMNPTNVHAFKTTLASIATTGGTSPSFTPVDTSTITIDAMPHLFVSPAGGVFGGSTIVSVTANKDADVYYTVNGTTPTQTSGTPNTGAGTMKLTLTAHTPANLPTFTTTPTTTLKLFARDAAGHQSATQTFTYTINAIASDAATLTCAGMAGTAPTFGDLYISEVEMNSASTTNADNAPWVEMHNKANTPQNLSCFEMVGGGQVYQMPVGTSIGANGYLTIHWRATGTNTSTDLFAAQTSYPGEVSLGSAGAFLADTNKSFKGVANSSKFLDFVRFNAATSTPESIAAAATFAGTSTTNYVWQDAVSASVTATTRAAAAVTTTVPAGKSYALIDDSARGGYPATWGVLTTPTPSMGNGTVTNVANQNVVGSFPGEGETSAPTTMSMVGVELSVALATSDATGFANSSTANAKFYSCSSSACTTPVVYPTGTWRYVAEGTSYRFVLPLTSALTTNTYYAFDIGALAKSGGGMTAPRKIMFHTSATAIAGGAVAPTAMASFPQPNQTSISRTIKSVGVNFTKPMDATSLTSSTFTITPTVALATTPITYDSATQTASLNFATGTTLAASTKYTVSVTTGAKDAFGIALVSAFSWSFTTGTTSDAAAPLVVGSTLDAYKNTAGSIQNVPRSVGTLGVSFDRALLASTVTSANVKLYQNSACSGTEISGTVFYRAEERGIGFTPAAPLAANAAHRLCISTAVKSVSDVALGSAVTFVFQTANTVDDATKPTISFVEADNYGVTVYFTEPVGETAAETASNYTLKVGEIGTFGTAWNAATTLSLANATLTYSSTENSVKITGISGLVPTKDFLVQIGTGVADLASNAFADPTTLSDTDGDVGHNPHGNPYRGIIADSTKSYTSASATSGSSTAVAGNFSANTNVGYIPSASARPGNALAGQTTTYGIDLPIAVQIPASGYIYVKFPSGFDVSSAKRDTNSPANNDLNGPGTGTVTFAAADGTLTGFDGAGGSGADGVLVNTTTNTVAIKLAAVATNAGGYDFLHFDLAGIRSSSTPKDYGTDGYTLTVKTINPTSGAILETSTTKPFFLKAGENNSLVVTLDLGGGNDGGASTADVYLNSPLTGPLTGTSDAFSAAGTNADATVTFSNIPAGEYQIFTRPTLTLNPPTNTDYAGQATPQTFKLNAGANTKTLTLTKLSGGTTASLVLAATCNAALAAESAIDLFANHPTVGFVVKTVTGADLCSGAASARTLKVPTGGTWSIGFGPALPRGATSASVTMPTGWMPPQPQNVIVANGGSVTATFSVNQTMRTITGSVVDTSGKAIASAEVYAYSPTGGLGSRATAGTDGAFSLAVADNTTYIVGANVPGMPSPKEQSVKIAGANVTSLTITIAKGSRQITGTVLSGDGSAPSTAFVYAYRTDAPGQANTQVDTQGGFTLYVAAGTWRVGANIPNQPPLTEQTVTVSSGSDPTALSFTATAAASLTTISGTVTNNAAPVAGVFVDAANTTTRNGTTTAADGTYEIKVPAGTYTVRASAPDIGAIGEIAVDTTGSDQPLQNFAVTTKTLTFTFATNGLTLAEVVIDARDETNKRGSHARATSIANGGTLTLTLPATGTYDLRVNVPGMRLATTAIAESDANLNYTSATGSLVVTNSGALTVTIPTTTRTVMGTVTAGGSALGDAWVEATSATTKAKVGARTDSSGAYALQLADGAYYFEVKKSGYTATPTQSTIAAAATTVNLSATASTTTISGTLTLNSTAAATGFVWAERYGGGYASTPVALDGTWSLAVGTGAWRVFGIADGYAQKEASNCIAIATTDTTCSTTATGVALNLTTTVSLNTPVTEPVTPASGGTVTDGATNFAISLTIPANALGSDTGSGSVTAKETTSAPKTETAQPFGGKAKEIKATDADGNPITTLNSAATIEFMYAKSELDNAFTAAGTTSPSITDVNTLTLSYWDETTLSWVTLPTTVSLAPTGVTSYADITSATLRGTTTHFSLFSAIVSAISSTVSASAPSASISSSSGGGGGGGGGGSSSTGVVKAVTQTITKAVTSTISAVANTFGTVSANVGKALTSLTMMITGGVHEKVATLSGAPVESVLTVENGGTAKSFTDILKSALGAVGSFLANLTIGDRLKTNAKDGVAVTVAQVAGVRMDKNTDVEIGDIAAKDGDAGVKMKHHAGQAWYKFRHISTGEPLHEIATTSTVATIRGTSVNVNTTADGTEIITLAEGSMSLTDSATNNVTLLNAGESYMRKKDGTITIVPNGVAALATSWRTSNTSADARFADFTDVKASDWFYAYITSLRQLGIIDGKTANAYEPTAPLTRAELIKIALSIVGTTASMTYVDGTFADVSTRDWYAPYIARAVQAGMAAGYVDGTFRPNQPVNRAEAVKILVAAKKLTLGVRAATFVDVATDAWYTPYLIVAKARGIIGGYADGTFRPSQTVNRAEIAKMATTLLGL